MFVQPDLTWRVLAVNFGFGGISLIVAAEVRAVPNRGPVERLIVLLAALCGVNFIVRTLMVMALYGPYTSYDGFYTSVYWTTALLSHAVLSLLIALSLFTAEALDLVKSLRSESLTDPLSGLLNRRGFEAKASALLDMCAPTKLPVALVVADLDRFKALNDRHGHAAGDRVIAEFAAHLRAAAGTRAVAGRMGGEEFAVLIPMADPAAARTVCGGSPHRLFRGGDRRPAQGSQGDRKLRHRRPFGRRKPRRSHPPRRRGAVPRQAGRT